MTATVVMTSAALFKKKSSRQQKKTPLEPCKAEFMGASEFLTWRVNAELQRTFEAGVPAFQVHHIETPVNIGLQKDV